MPIHDEMRGRKDGSPTRLVQTKPERAPDEPGYPWQKMYRRMKSKSGLKPLPTANATPDPFHPTINPNHPANQDPPVEETPAA